MEYEPGDTCPACEEGTFNEHESTGDMVCDECASVFSPRGGCKMNTRSPATPPWIDRHGEVDPNEKRQAQINDEGPGRSYPDHFYDPKSNRRL